MAALDEYYAGTTIRINVTVHDYDDNLLDPSTIVLSLIDPSGETVLDEVSMTQESTGVYYYNVQTGESWIKGDYLVKPVATQAGLTGLVKPYLFHLK